MTSSSSTSSVSFRDKTQLGRCYKFQHYVQICNFELGQLKEASLDSFFSRLRTLPKSGIHLNIQSRSLERLKVCY